MDTVQQAMQEKAYRELERRYEKERWSLLEFMKTYRRNEKQEELVINRHIEEMCKLLEAVQRWEIHRLMINIPPRSLKTETVAKMFPIWCLWHNNSTKIIALSYASTLAQFNSKWARDIYESKTFKRCFPRSTLIRQDQDTKKHRETQDNWQYYADGASGTVTGIGADIIIVDDPLKPDEADSDVIRPWVNNNFENTIIHRLNDKKQGAIVIIMQRLHDNDLCGYLIEKEQKGTGEERTKFIVPAISEWKSFFPERFPIEILDQMRTDEKTKIVFSTQYMQEPVNKDTQEFHEERYKYYNSDTLPKFDKMRIFTTCDPAFTKNKSSDYSVIVTGWFIGDELYILEYTQARLDPWELIEKLVYHIRKYSPEKVGVEAFQAQTIIGFNLKNELAKAKLFTIVEDIRQTGDKEAKIRKLIPLYRLWMIYHNRGMSELEFELRRFPRWQHDDIIDAVQMLYDLYTIQANAVIYNAPQIQYDINGNPFI